MCGIIGFIGNFYGFDKTFDGLQMLLNRGYDSCGCAGIVDNTIVISKYANTKEKQSIDLIYADKHKFDKAMVLLAHDRWGTCGMITDANAHPHIDYSGKIALVHNGIIENYAELKSFLEEKNIEFKSETDTEVISNLIGYYYSQENDLYKSIEKALSNLHGTWALGIICSDNPDQMFVTRHGSPLLIGHGTNFMMIASEQSGFAGHVNNYVCLNDSDIICIEKKEGKVKYNKTYEIKNITMKQQSTSCSPYSHWTQKEIFEQIQSSHRALNNGGRILNNSEVKLGGLDQNKNILKNMKHLVIIGCGSSLFAARRGAIYFKDLTNFTTIQCFDGGEFTHVDLPRDPNTCMIVLSQSGETSDIMRCVEIAKANNVFTIGLINVIDSYIAREVNCGCYLYCGTEVAVGATKSYTSMIIVLSLVAIWFAQQNGINVHKRTEYIKDLRSLPHDIGENLKIVEEKCKTISKYLKDKTSCFILGKGEMEPIAYESALKTKELTYLHCEGFSMTALKHGPFSLLHSESPCIILHPCSSNTDDYNRTCSTIDEIKTRNAPVIIITDNKNLSGDFVINVKQNSHYKGIMHVIPMQLIAYHLSLLRGINPDRPRNLAKSITVF